MATSKHAPTGNLPPKAPRIFSEADGQMFDHAIHARVSERAYHLYEASGGEHGTRVPTGYKRRMKYYNVDWKFGSPEAGYPSMLRYPVSMVTILRFILIRIT